MTTPSLAAAGRALTFLIVCLGLLRPASAASPDDTLRWTPDAIMRHRSISDVDLSPDGSLVDYVVGEAVMDPSRSEYLSHVWVGATDGSWNVQYTRREKSSSLPLFSPDRQYLAFTSSRSGENQVWVMRVGGGEAEQITSAKSGFRFARGLVHTLRPGGVAYVVIGNSILQGVMIPTDIYLGKIAELAGLIFADVRIPRTERVGSSIIQSEVRVSAAKSSDSLYEAVAVLRRP